MLAFQVDWGSMIGVYTKTYYNVLERLSYFIFICSMNIPVYIYIYFNTKNIQFKEWIKDIMSGYQILMNYSDSSIFIKKSPFFKETRVSMSPLRETNSDWLSSESNNSSIQEENPHNDDYMRNFKIHYASSASSSKASIRPSQVR